MKGNILRQTLFFISTSVLGPILLFGGIGYILDSYFGTNKIFTLSAIGVAFIVTQVLMFNKIKKGYGEISSHVKVEEEDPEEKSGLF